MIKCLPLSLQLLLDLSLDNLAHLLPAGTGADGSDAAFAVLEADELLGQDFSEVVAVLAAEGQVDGAGELGRVGRGQGDVADARVALDGAQGCGDTNGGVRVQDVTARLGALGTARAQVGREAGLVGGADLSDGLVVADALALELGLSGLEEGRGHAEAALGLELVEPVADVVASLLATLVGRAGLAGLVCQEPEETLEVAADQDVHGRAVGLLDASTLAVALAVGTAGAEETVQDVVLVGGDDELLGGETHALGEPTGQDVAEVTGGNDESHLVVVAGGLGQGEVGVEVVGDLSQDTGEVDAVDGGEVVGGVHVGIGEQGLDEVLAVIERTLDGEVVNVGIKDGGHLSLLDGRNLALGEQDEDGNILLATEAVNGSRASVTTCRTDNSQVVSVLALLALVLAHQEVLEEVSKTGKDRSQHRVSFLTCMRSF